MKLFLLSHRREMPHSGQVPDPFTSLYFSLAFGTGCLFYFQPNCCVLSIISPKSITFLPLCYLRDKKQTCVCSVGQLCPALCNLMDCSLPARPLCPWNFSGQNTVVGCHFLLQGIFLAQGLNSCLLCLLHWQVDLLPPHHLGSPHQ